MSADQLRQAYELIRQGQKEEAVVLLQPILRSDRNNADAWWLMANALTDPAKQVQALNEVLRLRPNDARAEKMLGRVQIDMQSKQNDFSFAVSDDDPFSSTSQSSSFSSASSSQDDPYSTSGSDPFSQSAGEKPKRGTAMPPPVGLPAAKKRTQSTRDVSGNHRYSDVGMLFVYGVCPTPRSSSSYRTNCQPVPGYYGDADLRSQFSGYVCDS